MHTRFPHRNSALALAFAQFLTALCFIGFAGPGCREINPDYLGPPGQDSGTSPTASTAFTTSTNTTTTSSGSTSDASSSSGSSSGTGPDAVPCSDDPDLVACYEFESLAQGVVVDDSVHSNDGMAAAASVVPGVSGTALGLTEESVVTVPDSDSLDLFMAMTLEMWVRPGDIPEVGSVWLLDKSNYQLEVRLDGGVRCHYGNEHVTGFVLTVGDWNHVACVYDGATLTLIVNGNAGPPTEAANANPGAIDDDLVLGNGQAFDSPYQGRLDSVRIWRVARTREQVCEDGGIDPC